MTEITTAISKQRRVGASRPKKHNPKTDMTPMVDLGFLLISFFVITTELSKPATLSLGTPKEGPPTTLSESDALTVLLSKNNTIYYYNGTWEDAMQSNQIHQTSFDSRDQLRKIIQEKQRHLDVVNKKEGRKGLMLLIKPGEKSNYSNIVDMLDEALIHQVEKYAVIKPDNAEAEYLLNK